MRPGTLALWLLGWVVLLPLLDLGPIDNLDVFFNQRTGQFILESGGVPWQDPFALDPEPRPWIEHKWLFDLLVHALSGGGTVALVAAEVALILGVFLVAGLRLGRRDPYPGLLLLVLLWPALESRLVLRSHTVGLLLMLGLLLLGERGVPGRRRDALALLGLVIWTNVHASFILGLGYLTLLFAVEAYESRKRLYRVFLPLAATLVGPYGPMVYYPLFSHYQAERFRGEYMAEWQPLAWTAPAMLPIVLALGLALLLVLRDRRKLPLPTLGLFFCCVGLLTQSGRFLPETLLTALPLFAELGLGLRTRRTLGAVLAAVLTVSTLWHGRELLALDRSTLLRPARVDLAAAAEFLEQRRLGGRVFHSFDYGQYLAAICHPEVSIYIDGRIDLYSEARFGRYLEAVQRFSGLTELDRLHRFDLLVLQWPGDRRRERFFLEVRASGRWVLVYLGEEVAIFTKQGRFPRVETEDGFTWLLPTAYLHRYDLLPRSQVMAEVERGLRRGNLGELPAAILAIYLERDPGARLRRLRALRPEHQRHQTTLVLLAATLRQLGEHRAAAEVDSQLEAVGSSPR
ncbi:MAG: hypothetical protein A2284_14305 [Deltaproteobacteria bacterium RIFOXYA12_FULL_61_11]|nr:MAG: hypothetical protein A2284_14305 [Deltaproteobacteria bacterium RIFOXYA12_FULL_61_11]